MISLRSILPGTTPAQIDPEDEYLVVRERTFQSMMLVVVGLTFALYVVLMGEAVRMRNYIDITFFTLVALLVVGIAVFRRIPYSFRSGGILLIVYGVSIFSLIQSGLSGHGQLIILAFAALAGVLAGIRAGIFALLLGLLTLALIGLGMTHGVLPVPPPGFNGDSSSQADWISSVAFYLLFAGMTTLPIGALLKGFRDSLREQKELSSNLEQERANLTKSVQERTADLERRITQIRAAAEISRSISSELDPSTLLGQMVNMLVERLGLYYAGLFLIDNTGRYAILRVGSGEAGRRMVADGHRLLVGGSSMIGWTTANRQARIALDVGEESIRFSNPYLPLTRSELALPIIGRSTVLGALTVQSSLPNAFDENDILVYQGIADSLAVALENAQMFQQNQRDLEEIRSLNRQYLERAWEETIQAQGKLAFTFEDPLAIPQPRAISMSLPVVLRDQVIGEISFDADADGLSDEDRAVVEAITTQTALALENARLLEETQRHAAQEERINTLSAKFSSAINIEDILQTAVQELSRLPAVTEVAVHLMPESKGTGPLEKPGKNGKERAA